VERRRVSDPAADSGQEIGAFRDRSLAVEDPQSFFDFPFDTISVVHGRVPGGASIPFTGLDAVSPAFWRFIFSSSGHLPGIIAAQGLAQVPVGPVDQAVD
jgi:hypothetical protein